MASCLIVEAKGSREELLRACPISVNSIDKSAWVRSEVEGIFCDP